jgi:DNA-binding CsgD family transcriptional regulator
MPLVMDISPRTLDIYRKRLMDMLGLHGLADMVRYAVRAGMVS